MNKDIVGAGMIALLATHLGCGGDSGSSCGVFAACGGDLIGNWTIANACYVSEAASQGFLDSCPQATVDAAGISVSGTAVFRADKTYTANQILMGSMSMTFPLSCFASGGITPTCDQVNQALMESAVMPDSPFDSATCGGSGASCTCTMRMRAQTTNVSGTFTTAGNNLTLTPQGGTPQTEPYCVSGGELRLANPSTSTMGMMGTMTMQSYLSLIKN